MIQSSHIAILYCEECDSKWSYGAADLEGCLARAKRDGWNFQPVEVRGVEVNRTTCPHCAKEGK